MSVAGMLPRFRKALERGLLTKTCTITPIVDTADGDSGYDQSRPASGAFTVKCAYQFGGSGGSGDLAYSNADTYRVQVPIGTTVNVADSITVDGLMLEVVDNRQHAGLDGLYGLDCVRVSGANA